MKPIELERGLFAGKPTGKEILSRVLYSLLAQPECIYPSRGWRQPTPDQLANWEARQIICSLIEKA